MQGCSDLAPSPTSGLFLPSLVECRLKALVCFASVSISVFKAKFYKHYFCSAFHFNPIFLSSLSNLSSSHCPKCSSGTAVRIAGGIGGGSGVIVKATARMEDEFPFPLLLQGLLLKGQYGVKYGVKLRRWPIEKENQFLAQIVGVSQ